MARHSFSLPCAHAGCRESGHYTVESRAAEKEQRARYRNGWWCTRHHARPETVLSRDNLVREVELVLKPVFVEGKSLGLFWHGEGQSGFVFGPGFRAFAEDFPEGTRIVVTTRVILPESVDMGGDVVKVGS